LALRYIQNLYSTHLAGMTFWATFMAKTPTLGVAPNEFYVLDNVSPRWVKSSSPSADIVVIHTCHWHRIEL